MLLIDFPVNGSAAGRPVERQMRSWNLGLTDGGALRSGIASGVPFFLQNFLPEGVHGAGFASALEVV